MCLFCCQDRFVRAASPDNQLLCNKKRLYAGCDSGLLKMVIMIHLTCSFALLFTAKLSICRDISQRCDSLGHGQTDVLLFCSVFPCSPTLRRSCVRMLGTARLSHGEIRSVGGKRRGHITIISKCVMLLLGLILITLLMPVLIITFVIV